jgi:hypothetical protein
MESDGPDIEELKRIIYQQRKEIARLRDEVNKIKSDRKKEANLLKKSVPKEIREND